jgi:hypothetical protein
MITTSLMKNTKTSIYTLLQSKKEKADKKDDFLSAPSPDGSDSVGRVSPQME